MARTISSNTSERLAECARFAIALFMVASSVLACGAAAAVDWTYRVRPGDTVWDLTRTYIRDDVGWQRMQTYNKVIDPYHLVPGTLLRFPVRWLKVQPAPAIVVGVIGDATATDAAGRRSIVAGMALRIGTTVETAPGASLTLRFADGSELLLHASSALQLDKLSAYGRTGMVDTRMRLRKGRVDSHVRPLRGPAAKYIIDTPDIMSSVRGTRFRVGSDGGTSQVEVTEGRVLLERGPHDKLLRADQGVVSAGDTARLQPQPLLPAPDGLAVDATQRPIRVQWKPVPGATAYRVEAGANDSFPYLLYDHVVTGTEALLDALPDGDHALRVRAIAANGLEGRNAVVESAIILPAPFALESPDGLMADVDRPRFRWASMGEGSRYHLQVAGSDGYAAPLVDLPGIARTEVRSPVALAPGEYRWRIATQDRQGRTSAYNDGGDFTVVPPAAGPDVSETVSDPRDALRIRWKPGAPGQHYRFQLSRTPDFANVSVDEVAMEPQATIPGLHAGRWYARVQAIDSDGYARPFGPAQTFKVGCLPCRWAIAGGAVLLILSL